MNVLSVTFEQLGHFTVALGVLVAAGAVVIASLPKHLKPAPVRVRNERQPRRERERD